MRVPQILLIWFFGLNAPALDAAIDSSVYFAPREDQVGAAGQRGDRSKVWVFVRHEIARQ
jgi:hypothetical protein